MRSKSLQLTSALIWSLKILDEWRLGTFFSYVNERKKRLSKLSSTLFNLSLRDWWDSISAEEAELKVLVHLWPRVFGVRDSEDLLPSMASRVKNQSLHPMLTAPNVRKQSHQFGYYMPIYNKECVLQCVKITKKSLINESSELRFFESNVAWLITKCTICYCFVERS